MFFSLFHLMNFNNLTPTEQSEYVAGIDDFSVNQSQPSRGDERRDNNDEAKFYDVTQDSLLETLRLSMRELNLSDGVITDLSPKLAKVLYKKLRDFSLITNQAITRSSSMEITPDEAATNREVKRLKVQMEGVFAELRKDLLFIISLAFCGTESALQQKPDRILDQYTLNKLIHYHAGTAINQINQHLNITYEITEQPVEPDKL